MRLLHVDTGRSWRGGQAQVAYLLEGLVAAGHEPVLAAPEESPLHERLRGGGVVTRVLPIRGDLDLAAVARLAALARSERVSVIHAHAAGAHLVSVAAARLAGVPHRIVTRRLDLPVGTTPWSRLKYRSGVTRYVAISRRVARVLEAGGVDPARIAIVYSGVPVDGVPRADDPMARAAARDLLESLRPGGGDDAPLLGSIGALSPQKGHDIVLRAVAALRTPVRLVIIGSGPEEGRLRELAGHLGVRDSTTFAGFRTDVARLLPGFDLILAPSRHEGLGTTVLEAMAAGLPVVASRVCEFPEMLEEGAAGALVPAEDAAALARTTEELLRAPDRRAALGMAARRRAQEYSVERMIEGNLNVYKSLIGDRQDRLSATPKRDGRSSTGGSLSCQS